jgi:hypothetical protein
VNPFDSPYVRSLTGETITTLFSLLNGDTMLDTFDAVGGPRSMLWSGLGRLFLASFIMLFTYAVLNVFISIIQQAWEEVHHETAIWRQTEEEQERAAMRGVAASSRRGSMGSDAEVPPPSGPALRTDPRLPMAVGIAARRAKTKSLGRLQRCTASCPRPSVRPSGRQ